MKKKGIGILFLIWGSVVCIVGILIFMLEIQMLFTSSGGSELGSMLVLLLFTLLFIAFLGVLPLVMGIKKMKTVTNVVQEDNLQIENVEQRKPLQTVYKRDKEENHLQTAYEGDKEKNHSQTAYERDKEKNHLQTAYEGDKEENHSQTAYEGDKEENPTQSAYEATRILCRDEQFDKGEWSFVRLLLGFTVAGFTPVIFTVYFCALVSNSVGGRIMPGTIQAWSCFVVVVLASTGAMFFFYYIAKNNAVGNKFFFYVLDEEKGLYFAHMGMGGIGNYIKNNTPLGEKIKNSFSFLYTLLFFLYRSPGVSLVQFIRMDSYFKINKRYHFAETLLLKENLDRYCSKIVAVKKIKFFFKGCEVWLVTMEHGIENVKRQIIYRNTSNYPILMKELNKLYTGKESESYELSVSEMKQVRRNIYRRMGVFCISLLVFLLLAFLCYYIYLSASFKATVYEQDILKRIEYSIANRSQRRIFKIVYFVLFVQFGALIKMFIDLFKTASFKCLSVEVVEYIAPKFSIWNIFNDYNYYATVRYNGEIIRVGMSKAMWKQRKSHRVSLVLRKNVPYCIVV